MIQPSIQCLGVYAVPYDQAVWREDMDGYYQSLGILAETAEYRFQLVSIALIEVAVSGADSTFDVGHFRQPMERAPGEAAQVAYDEALLSADGQSVIQHRQGCADGIKEGRICFFLRHYDPYRPILWTYGEFICPPAKLLDDRLARLVSYRSI